LWFSSSIDPPIATVQHCIAYGKSKILALGVKAVELELSIHLPEACSTSVFMI
jgi:hypothetical protein